MEREKTGAITHQDFELFQQEMKSDFGSFKQEMKHEFQIFQRDVKELIVEVVNERISKIVKILGWVGAVIVIAFSSYFEYMRTKVDQINNDRMAKLEYVLEQALLVSAGRGVVEMGMDRQKPKKKSGGNVLGKKLGKGPR